MTSAQPETSPKTSLSMLLVLLIMKLLANPYQLVNGTKESKLQPMMLPLLDNNQARTSAIHQALLNGLNMLHTASHSWLRMLVNLTTVSGLLDLCLCQTTTSA